MASHLWPSPSEPLRDEEIITLLRDVLKGLSESLEDIDVEALANWIVVGTYLFRSSTLPSMRAVTIGARQVLLVRAMKRFGGNITHVAQAVSSSRRSVRDKLIQHGLYTSAEGGPPRAGGSAASPQHPDVSEGAPTEIEVDDDADTHPIHSDDGTQDPS